MNLLGGGSVARIHDDQGNTIFSSIFQGLSDYYTSQGVDSAVFRNDVDTQTLDGVDLLVVGLPSFFFTADESAAMREFVQSGGNIIFLGEVNNALMSNWYINSALSQVGSTLRIVNQSDFDGGGGFTTITGPQITDDPFTRGVDSFSYAFSSQVTAPDGTGLFYGEDGELFLAYQTIPAPASAAMIPFAFAVCTRRRR